MLSRRNKRRKQTLPTEMNLLDAPFSSCSQTWRMKTKQQRMVHEGAVRKERNWKVLLKSCTESRNSGMYLVHNQATTLEKSCISRLLDANSPENFVTQLSGQKNIKSLQSYKSASEQQQCGMSRVLSPLHYVWNLRKFLQGQLHNLCVFPQPSINKKTCCKSAKPLKRRKQISRFFGKLH